MGNILQELDDAPGVLASVYQICDVYNKEIRLKNLVWDFYGIMVDCLLELMIILNRTYKDNGKRSLVPNNKAQRYRKSFALTTDNSF